MTDTFRDQALKQIMHKAWHTRQIFDGHSMRADEIKDRLHLEELEILIAEIGRLRTEVAWLQQGK
jgi:hypothetical protein